MNYVEFGKQNNDVIILLHGGGLSWWNYREVAEKLGNSFHVVLPILNGHAKSDSDFTTIEDNATQIIDFVDSNFNGEILLLGGLSLGAQIALEILAKRKNICKFAVIESALCIPSKFTHAMIKPAFGSCYGLIKRKWFAKLQFKSLRIKQDLFDDYYKDTCEISKNNLIAFMQQNSLYTLNPTLSNCLAKVGIFVGEKESGSIKKSAKIINEALPNSALTTLPKLYHGEFCINHADDFVNEILNITNKG